MRDADGPDQRQMSRSNNLVSPHAGASADGGGVRGRREAGVRIETTGPAVRLPANRPGPPHRRQ